VERDLRAGDLTRRQILATVVRLLDKTLIRVGNDEYARENRSSASPPCGGRHVEIVGSRLRFTFRGKSGVSHEVAITDRRLAASSSSARTSGTGTVPSISTPRAGARASPRTTSCVSPGDDRPRHHRQGLPDLAGTMLAAKQLCAIGPAKTRREAERNMLRAIDTVADRLGNTRAVSRKYYVHRGCCGHISRGSP